MGKSLFELVAEYARQCEHVGFLSGLIEPRGSDKASLERDIEAAKTKRRKAKEAVDRLLNPKK